MLGVGLVGGGRPSSHAEVFFFSLSLSVSLSLSLSRSSYEPDAAATVSRIKFGQRQGARNPYAKQAAKVAKISRWDGDALGRAKALLESRPVILEW